MSDYKTNNEYLKTIAGDESNEYHKNNEYLKMIAENGTGGGGGTDNYTSLSNKPKINGVVLNGDKSAEDLELVKAEAGKGLSTNDYTNEAVAEVAKIADKVDQVEGKGLSSNDYTDADKAEVAKVENKVDKVDGKGLSSNDYTDTDKSEVDKVKDKLDTTKLTDGSIRKIIMEDDSTIASEGNGLHLQYSDNEINLTGSILEIHNIAGGESRVTLDDGSLLLEGSPYWNNNAKIKLSANGEDGASYVDIDANDINLKGNVKVNGQALGQATRIITVTGANHPNEGNYLTSRELFDGGVRDGTYLIHAHSNTSNSSCLFWGYISLGENGFDDFSFTPISGTRMWCDYSTERLYYSGGDIGSICSMDFIKISNYVDN